MLVFIISGFLVAAFQPLGAQAADADAQISSVREQWEKAWNAKDLQTLIGLYADDAVLIFNDNSITGKDTIKQQFSDINQFSRELSLKPEHTKGMSDTGNLQYIFSPPPLKTGSSKNALKFGASANALRLGNISRRMHGNYTMNLKREKGKLLIAEHVWTETPAK